MMGKDEIRRIEDEKSRWVEKMKCQKEVADHLFTPADIQEIDYLNEIGFPGQYPFTRGNVPAGYRDAFWQMQTYAGFGGGESANERLRRLVEKGSQRLLIALDLATQLGLDPDHPLAQPEVGRIGVSMSTTDDMEGLLQGISLEKTSIETTANAMGSIFLAWYLCLGERKGLTPERMAGCTLQNDILKEYTCRSTYIFPPRESMKLAIDIIEYYLKYLPTAGWCPMRLSGSHMRHAGANFAQHIAFAYANAFAYLEMAQERGMTPQQLVPMLRMHFVTSLNILEEAAGLRAARRVWARLMREKFHQDLPLWLSAGSPVTEFTAQQPLNNIIRNTLAVMAAVLGGIQGFLTLCHDEALAIPTEEAHTVALRTQQIIAYESGIPKLIDPLAGSYYVEATTKRIEEEIWSYLKKIEELGGAVAAIESGYVQKVMADGAHDYQKEIETGKRNVVGVNKFVEEEKIKIPVFPLDREARMKQAEKIKKFRASRNNGRVQSSLVSLKKAAQGKDNLVPFVIEAVRSDATLQEICDTLKEVFGEYAPQTEYL